jgi:apolipoprotein N-acyltransferase
VIAPGRTPPAAALSGRRTLRFVMALVSGAAVAFSFPDAAVGPLIFVALAPLIAALVAAPSTREAFFLGTSASTVTWLINVPWVINVMHQYGGLPKATGIAIFIAMAIVLGLFTGIFFGMVIHRLRLGSSPLPWLLVPAAWVATEYARTYLLAASPWNQLAAAIIDIRPLAQLSAVLGPYGVGYFIAIPSTLLAWLVSSGASTRRKLAASGAVAAILAVWCLHGLLAVRWQDARIASEMKSGAALVQPNITQQMRWGESTVADLFVKMMTMTEAAIEQQISVVVWPESTIPLTYLRTRFLYEAVEEASSRGPDIILGSVAEDDTDPTKLWNAAYLVSGGRTVGRYDKIKLVPFGEYVPLRKVIFFAEKLVHAVGEFQVGTSDRPLVGKFRYGLAICYEVVYPQIPRAQVRNGADVLVTITNDGWFDRSSALRQHLNSARLRAIEGDRYLLRAATTGITALVDPTGRIVSEIAEGGEGILVGGFAPRQSRTPYVRFGDWFAMAACLIVAAALLYRARPQLPEAIGSGRRS